MNTGIAFEDKFRKKEEKKLIEANKCGFGNEATKLQLDDFYMSKYVR